MSSELETLDQLLGGEMPLAALRDVYPDNAGFHRGMLGLLASGDVRLLENGSEVPSWRWRDVQSGDLEKFTAVLTEAGAKRIE